MPKGQNDPGNTWEGKKSTAARGEDFGILIIHNRKKNAGDKDQASDKCR